jgi:hypothetical protein
MDQPEDPVPIGLSLRTRHEVAAEIESLLEKCKLKVYCRCESRMHNPDGTAEVPAVYLNWYESSEKYIGILVSDLHTQIAAPLVPPCTVLDNNDPHFAQLLTGHLAPYC